jgi:predicted  nucleic acid-binding Zn-ribbon protein
LVLFGWTSVHAQTSDYQIKKGFQATYTVLNEAIENAGSVSELDTVVSEISEFEAEFSDHKELLDNALYPETFESSFAKLKQDANNTERRLLIIESQDEKLSELSSELSSYKNELERLSNTSDSLRNAINKSEQSERELAALVQQYRQSLEFRDNAVLNIVDSLFITYRDLKTETSADLVEFYDNRKIVSQDNPLEFISDVVEENIQILKTDEGTLQTEDYLRMHVVQTRFSEVWNQIGNDLVNIYAGSNKEEWKTEIESKLSDWEASSSRNMWASIDEYLESNDVDLGAFDSNKSFYASIEAFINDATDLSRENVITDENYEQFQSFYAFWNGKIKSEWGDFVQEGDVLTMTQISAIDSEIMNWRDEAKPRSFFIPILLGISLLTIVGLIIVLARK